DAARAPVGQRADERRHVEFVAVGLAVQGLPPRPQRLELAPYPADAAPCLLVGLPILTFQRGRLRDDAAMVAVIDAAAIVPLGIGKGLDPRGRVHRLAR